MNFDVVCLLLLNFSLLIRDDVVIVLELKNVFPPIFVIIVFLLDFEVNVK